MIELKSIWELEHLVLFTKHKLWRIRSLQIGGISGAVSFFKYQIVETCDLGTDTADAPFTKLP